MLGSKFSKYKFEAGTDEAGRGCLSGPVVAAAVILPDNFRHDLLNDSKQLTEKQRIKLRPIIEKGALSYSVSFIYQRKIDEINILNASILAMHKAIDELEIVPEFIIVDQV
jgi:ribonuclease HII